MKIYEVIEKEKNLNEGVLDLLMKVLGPAYSFIRTTAIFAPIASAVFNIYRAREKASQGDPDWTKENLAAYEQKELGVLTATLAARFLGNKAINSVGWVAKLASFFNPRISSMINSLSGVAKTSLAAFLALPEGAKFIANWLAGELFYDGKQIPGGQTWESVIGGLSQKGLDTAIDTAKKVTGDDQGAKAAGEEPGEIPSEPKKTELPKGVIGKQKQWIDPNEPVYARGLKRNPVTGQLEVDL